MAAVRASTRKAIDAYHHGDLHAALVDAATRQVEAGGPESVSLSAIAKSLGVSQAAPYRHFSDREDLLVAVATRGFIRCRELLEAAVDGVSAPDKLARLASSYVDIGTGNAGLYRLMYASHLVERSAIGSPLQVAVEAGFQWWLGLFHQDVDQAIRERIALKLWVSLHGIVMLIDQGFLPFKIRKIRAEQLVSDLVADAEKALAGAPVASSKRRNE